VDVPIVPRAQELQPVAQGIFLWQFYDPTVHADLFATALETPSGLCLIDPIPLDRDPMNDLRSRGKVTGIVVTNANHIRAMAEFASTFSVPVFAHHELRENPDFANARWIQDGESISSGLAAIAIDGGPPGEIALYYNEGGGVVVLGDALINFEPYGFGLLPAKYCSNPKHMRRSLQKLLDYPFDRMLFAHGTPILTGARVRLEALLAANR
jgi:glyoxylase-like metal-dependent hydrolase (beta-lactamase superfamily II)